MYILLGRKPNNVNYKERGIYIFYSDIINEMNWYKNIPRLNHFESQHHQSRHHDTYLPRNIHKNPTILYYMFQPWNQSCLPLGSMMLHQNCLHSHLILIHSLNTVLTRYQVCRHATSFTLVAEPYCPKPLSLLDNVPTGALSKRDRYTRSVTRCDQPDLQCA